MARLIKRFRNQPHTVVVGGQTLSICGCGLSATQPYCDGTHKICESEELAKLYWYDDAKQPTLPSTAIRRCAATGSRRWRSTTNLNRRHSAKEI